MLILTMPVNDLLFFNIRSTCFKSIVRSSGKLSIWYFTPSNLHILPIRCPYAPFSRIRKFVSLGLQTVCITLKFKNIFDENFIYIAIWLLLQKILPREKCSPFNTSLFRPGIKFPKDFIFGLFSGGPKINLRAKIFFLRAILYRFYIIIKNS